MNNPDLPSLPSYKDEKLYKIYDRKSMSCIAVLITQHITSDLKAATQIRAMARYQDIFLTRSHRSIVVTTRAVCYGPDS
jgi:hypothetical protein